MDDSFNTDECMNNTSSTFHNTLDDVVSQDILSRDEKSNYVSNKVVNYVKLNTVDNTSLCIGGVPVFALSDVGVTGMSVAVSLKSRIFGASLGYCGLGLAYSFFRGVSRNIFGIHEKSNELLQVVHDSVYSASFSIPLSVGFYTFGGEEDVRKIVVGTALGAGYSFFTGGATGWSVDVYRDLVGIQTCDRRSYPNFLKQRGNSVKKIIAGGLVVASLGITTEIYSHAKTIHDTIHKAIPVLDTLTNSPEE